ncbi:MAG: potassium transporter TrkG [SAR202 cluster bacterium]|nr:potassium transporter TrkG [SAR202 cluster bacterium]
MRQDWQPKPGDRVIRHPRQEEMGPIRVTVKQRRVQSRAGASPLIIVLIFAILVAISTGLLLLPFTHHGAGMTPFMDALFTATSAVTVTGLVIQETSTYWTPAGQIVLMGIIFVGGLGFMTLATFLLVLVGQRVTLRQRLLIRESLGANQLGGLVRMTVGIVLVAIGIQVVGFVALAIRFWFIYPPGEALWQAAFHAVSGFNNAGFIALKEEAGLEAFQADGAVIGIFAALIFLGAISYGVIIDMVQHRKFKLFGLNTKLVLTFYPIMLLLGMGLFLLFEYTNPATLGALPVSQKLTTSMFEAVNITAGFSTIDYAEAEQQTGFIMSGLMFVGGASASVAGGIKINTLAVVIVAISSTIQGRAHASAYGREIPDEQVRRALTVGSISLGMLFLVVLLLTLSNTTFDFLSLIFESVSAFSTVGLSTGITPDLSQWGHIVLVVAMFVGRIGPFTLVIALAQKAEGGRYRFAEEHVTIG